MHFPVQRAHLQCPATLLQCYAPKEKYPLSVIIVLPFTSQRGAHFFADEIRTNVGNLRIPHEKSLTSGFVAISLDTVATNVGVSVSHEELTRQADSALYIAKKMGRNRVEAYHEFSA
jgi:diguanylate cyclase (GGDEF)-like protein